MLPENVEDQRDKVFNEVLERIGEKRMLLNNIIPN